MLVRNCSGGISASIGRAPVGDHAGERAALEPVGRPRRSGRRRRRGGRVPPPRIWIGIPKWSFAQRQAALAVERVGTRVEERRHGAAAASRSSVLRASTWVRCTSYGSAAASRRLEPAGIVGRVDAGGSATTLTSNPCAVGELHAAERRRLAGGVAVEREPQPLGEPPELAQLLLGERGAHARNDRLEPGLPQRDHVGVPLDDAGTVLAGDRRAALSSP